MSILELKKKITDLYPWCEYIVRVDWCPDGQRYVSNTVTAGICLFLSISLLASRSSSYISLIKHEIGVVLSLAQLLNFSNLIHTTPHCVIFL